MVLDDIYEAVLAHLQPADVATLRCVCRCLRAKTDMLLRTLRLSQPHVKQAAARFQVDTLSGPHCLQAMPTPASPRDLGWR